MPDTVLDRLSVEKRVVFWRQVIEQAEKQFVLIAIDEQDTIIGFVNGGSRARKDALYTAELYALYLLKESQGHGYGKALVLATMRAFVERGHNAQRHAAVGTLNEPRSRLL